MSMLRGFLGSRMNPDTSQLSVCNRNKKVADTKIFGFVLTGPREEYKGKC